MTGWSLGVILAICAVCAVVLVVDLVRDRAAQDAHYVSLAVLEVGVLVQLVAGLVAVGRTDRDVDGAVFGSYLVTIVVIPLVAAFFSLAERSRVGTTILLLGVAAVAGLELRLWDLWAFGDG